MALANVACLLAQRQSQAGERGVLVIDWDLEAPGLHRFFRDRFHQQLGAKDDYAQALDLHPGLMDLFTKVKSVVQTFRKSKEEITTNAAAILHDSVELEEFVLHSDIDRLSLMKAGRFNAEYPSVVNTFNWEQLYNDAPWLIPWLTNWLAQSYRYVLIDSRTGVTDTSGICTMLLPDKLVAVFTPNAQSLDGVLDLVGRATTYRRRSDDLRPLMVFPLPSRIEAARPSLRDRWRLDTSIGYQPRFQDLLKRVYGISSCDLTTYFDEVQVFQVPDYAYGEEIAVLVEHGSDKLSLTGTYKYLTDRLLRGAPPWQDVATSQASSPAQDLVRIAFNTYSSLTAEQQSTAMQLMGRLVRVSSEKGAESRVRASRSKLAPTSAPIIEAFAKAGLIVVRRDQEAKEEYVEIVHDAITRDWSLLQNWLDQNRSFLLWRQRLDDNLTQWEENQADHALLLRGSALEVAQRFKGQPGADLNDAERKFIEASASAERDRLRQERQRKVRTRIIVAGLALLLISAIYVALVAVRNLAAARIAADEASVVGSLRVLNTAEITYSATYNNGFSPDLKSLDDGSNIKNIPDESHAGLIDDVLASGNKYGYQYTYVPHKGTSGTRIDRYEIYADPIKPGKSAKRHFFTDESGVIRAIENGRAGPDSAPLAG
jgi:hypothetical protein